jgi:hypothetical protein
LQGVTRSPVASQITKQIWNLNKDTFWVHICNGGGTARQIQGYYLKIIHIIQFGPIQRINYMDEEAFLNKTDNQQTNKPMKSG